MTIKEMLRDIVKYVRSLFNQKNIVQDIELTYRTRVKKLLDYYSGEQIQHLKNLITEQFSRPDRMVLQPRIANITRYITDNLCMLFSKGVLVKALNESDEEIYQEIVDSTELDAIMQDAERKTFLTKNTLLKVSWRDDSIKLDIITPEYVVVNTEDENPYEIKDIVYPIKLDDRSLYNPQGTFAYWSETEFKIVNESGIEQKNEANPDNINPYGIIPIVIIRDSIPANGEFFNKVGEELINAQDSINLDLTQLAYLQKMQAFSQPVITNPATDMQGNINVAVDPSRPIVLKSDKENPASFEFVTPDAKLAEIQDSVDKSIERIGALYGIDVSSFVASGQKSSADATKEFNATINEYREKQKLLYLPILVKLFEIIKIVYNTHASNQLSEAGVQIQILDPKRGYTSVDDKIKETDYMLSKNFVSLPEAMTIWMDDITEEEAQERIIKNKETDAQLNIQTNPENNSGNNSEKSDGNGNESVLIADTQSDKTVNGNNIGEQNNVNGKQRTE